MKYGVKNVIKEKNIRMLNREMLKYAAIAAMLLNHISDVFFEKGSWYGELCLDIGYITAPLMCFFLVEGYYYTHSRIRYMLRLLGFGVLSQVPFYMALSQGEQWPGRLNMMFTLFLCFLLIEVKVYVRSEIVRYILFAGIIIMNSFCDWPTMAPVYTLLFAYAYGSQKKMMRAVCISTGIFLLPMYMTKSMYFSGGDAVAMTGIAAFFVLAAGMAILYLYNGKQANRGRKFSKWFFYLFYPAHLLVLGILRMVCFS